MKHKCPDCRNPLEACSCESWWKAFQEGFYEALDARMNRQPLPVRIPNGVDLPEGLRIDLELRRLAPKPTDVCEHDKPLAGLGSQAMCWDCGRLFELDEFGRGKA